MKQLIKKITNKFFTKVIANSAVNNSLMGQLLERVVAIENKIDTIINNQNNPFQRIPYVNFGKDQFVIVNVGTLGIVISSEQYTLLRPYLLSQTSLEAGLRTALRSFIKPGMSVVDLGANVGLFTTLMADLVGPAGKVYAFEPNPRLTKPLQMTIDINWFRDRVVLENKAVMDKSQKVLLDICDHSPMSTIYSYDKPTAQCVGDFTAQEVEATSLDDYFPKNTQIDFIKIDIEGAEPIVWKGMQRIISENPKLAGTLEIGPTHFERAGQDLNQFLHELQNQRFRVQAVQEPDGKLLDTTYRKLARESSTNIIFSRG